jgi:hypothetical protein
MKKHILILAVALASFQFSQAQEALPSIGSFGSSIDSKGALTAKKLPKKLNDEESVELTVKGKVVEVCQKKGCWMTIDLGKGETMRVKFKDYGFFVPKDAAGKTAIMQGVASREEVTVDELRHLAEDAGNTKEEVAAIVEPRQELTFVAEGVIIK